MWPVAIKNEPETFCAFIRCSKSTRELASQQRPGRGIAG
jgi:hypothetical protein